MNDGLLDAQEEVPDEWHAGYAAGYAAGFDNGYSEGFTSGNDLNLNALMKSSVYYDRLCKECKNLITALREMIELWEDDPAYGAATAEQARRAIAKAEAEMETAFPLPSESAPDVLKEK